MSAARAGISIPSPQRTLQTWQLGTQGQPTRINALLALLGEWSAAPAQSVAVHAPFTGTRIAMLPAAAPADVAHLAGRARGAQAAWAAAGARARCRILLRFHDRLLARQDEILDLVQIETGKARLHAFEEVADTANLARFYGVHGPRLLRAARRQGAVPLLTRTVERHVARGLVGLFVPWNYPLNLAISDALAALAAGNAVLLKPDPQTTLTALCALDLLQQSGLPPDVLTIVPGDGPTLGPSIIDTVDYVMFTGSTATGRVIARRAAARLIGAALELGGKNPMIVRSDADLDCAVDGAIRGCFVGAGQVCVSIERLYVHQRLFEPFVQRLVARARALRLSAALDYTGDVGSLASERQLVAVVRHVEDARAAGARVLAGGRHRPEIGPFFYEPTVLAGVSPDMLVYAEETFGPVVSVYPVASDAEAIAAANESCYGLNASVWTRDTRAGTSMATRLQAGMVNINEAYAAAWGSAGAPAGGMKTSGVGVRHGREGLLKFTTPQAIAVQRVLPLAPAGRMTHAQYARLMTWGLRLRRWLPGLR